MQLDFIKSELAHSWAKFIIARKITEQKKILIRASYREKDTIKRAQLINGSQELSNYLRKIEGENDLNSLRGIEGYASRVYFAAFNDLLKVKGPLFHWTRRSRRPPRDSLNALISFLYSLALQVIESVPTANSLDTGLGVLHARRTGRPSLSLDFLDIVRSGCDRLAITLINRKQLDGACFQVQEGAIMLNSKGRSIVIESFNGQHTDNGLRNRILFCIDREAKNFLKLINHDNALV